jgi:hypothetical protein
LRLSRPINGVAIHGDDFEPRHHLQNRRETLLLDGAGRLLADRFRRVLPAKGFFPRPLFAGCAMRCRSMLMRQAP